MGMQSAWGAESAAEEIIKLIAIKKLEYVDHPMAVKALEDIEAKAQKIYTSAKAGYN